MSKVIKKEYLEAAVPSYNLRTAMEEASRCLLCHDAPCSMACPAGTDCQGYVGLIANGQFEEAIELITSGKVDVKKILTKTVPMDEAPETIIDIEKNPGNYMKVVVDLR